MSQPTADEPVGAAHDAQPAKVAKVDDGPVWKNKEKVLLLSSRGITHRYSPSTIIYVCWAYTVLGSQKCWMH